jgi:nucleotide-binding universal stress UspA family protein
MYKHLLVPVDGSALSLKALDSAAGLATALGAAITVVTVSPPFPMMVAGDGYVLDLNSPSEWETSIERHAVKVRQAAEKRAKSKNVTIKFISVVAEQPYEGIINTAKKAKCDVIVMASHGRKGLSALLLGSETTKVLTHSKVPVLVCR